MGSLITGFVVVFAATCPLWLSVVCCIHSAVCGGLLHWDTLAVGTPLADEREAAHIVRVMRELLQVNRWC